MYCEVEMEFWTEDFVYFCKRFITSVSSVGKIIYVEHLMPKLLIKLEHNAPIGKGIPDL